MTLLSAALLGAIQGLTEFLPVSSSAHLILARAVFGWEAAGFGLAFDVAVHVGTLLAVVAFFRAELVAMAAAAPSAISRDAEGPARLLRLVAVGTVPAVAVGVLFGGYIETTLRTPPVAAWALAIVAAALLAAERLGPRWRSEADLGWHDAMLVGCAQAAALVPGVSRSGATIAMAMFLGVRRDAAARFTFLLAVPAILAAAGKTALEVGANEIVGSGLAAAFAAGTITSAVVGYVTIKYFLRYLAGHSLDVFAYYRLALAGGTFAWLLA